MWRAETLCGSCGVLSQSSCTRRTLCFNHSPLPVQQSLSNFRKPHTPYSGFREWAVLPQAHLLASSCCYGQAFAFIPYISTELKMTLSSLKPVPCYVWGNGVLIFQKLHGSLSWTCSDGKEECVCGEQAYERESCICWSLLPLSFPIEPEGTASLSYFPFHGQSCSWSHPFLPKLSC